mmetsp:Transcript_42165/g.66031  ORF Transcript_42165/g.66031 Transcript_42165/m.66031 type:complete len:219 (-) Transcript_42165:1033-1689(-)
MGLGQYYEDFWQAVESGSFKSYARGFAVVNLLLLVSVPFLCLITARFLPVLTFVMMEICGVLMGILEMPYCCTCLQACQKCQPYLRYAEPHWIRGVFYIVLGAVLITVSNEVDHHAAGWSFGIFLPINGLLYLVASLRGEPTSTDKDDEKRGTEFSDIGRAERGDGGTGRDEARQGGSALENAAKEMASDPGVQKAAFTAMKNNPGLAKEALKAAAKV